MNKLTLLFLFMTVSLGNCAEEPSSFCNETLTEQYDTECFPCEVLHDCPGSTAETVKKCTYAVIFEGCYNTCYRNVTTTKCCPGFWGDACDECPGGSATPCNSHGACNVTDGSCTCQEGWTGYACEFCTNSSVSPNCTQDYGSKFCDNARCPSNSQCLILDREPSCVCQWPFVEHRPSTDNGTKSEIVCKEVDPCNILPLCDTNANCSRGQEPGTKECSCFDNYHGDGFVCDLTNPCQDNYGGCEKGSTQCVNTQPGKRECRCLRGYSNYVEGQGCSLTDLCPSLAPSTCHKRATCITETVDRIRCICPAGYIGDGSVCYGNLLQTMKDENKEGPVKGQLGLFITTIERYYSEALTSHGPFTVFVPNNEGFRGTNTADFQKWLEDEPRVRQVLRQHIVVGDFLTENLLNTTVFHTLQGTEAELFVANRDTLKFRLMGSSRKANIITGDIHASNGVIHVISRLMTNSPETASNQQVSVHELIATNGKYNRLQTYIAAAGEEIINLLIFNNVTMFAPDNSVLDSLPQGSLEYLTSPAGKGKLVTILKNHIILKVVDMATLINTVMMQSAAKYLLSPEVSNTGQVVINGNVKITQSDIMAKNGLLFDIDRVILPDHLYPLPNRCDQFTYKLVQGPCDDCRESLKCFEPDIETPERSVCNFYVKNPEEQYVKAEGCALMCNRTYSNAMCCDNFYGFDCLPCPGGYKNPCNGNGQCNEGYSNNGTCTCDEGFTGEACERCSNPRHFGPNCTQVCTCLHGVCDDGPTGSGKCKAGMSCYLDMFWGENCDKYKVPCRTNLYCHAHSLCILGKDFNFRCICNPGYIGSGEECVPLNPCTLPEFGGCHRQAVCLMTGPGQNNCTCRPGWSGDGTYCYPATSCDHHGNCHKDAQCLETTPGENICLCNAGYHGNGTYCVLTDMCTDKNGGCHSKAVCTPTGPGRVNCSCLANQGYMGSGYNCYGNLITQIEDHPQLTLLSSALKQVIKRDYAWILNDNFTVFAPTDNAFKEFGKSIGNKHWLTADTVMELIAYHFVMNSSTLAKLYPIAQYMGKISTMVDGFYLHLDKNGTEQYIVSSGLGIKANILEADIVAQNGYINIIDRVLEPYAPTNPDDYPDLTEFLDNNPQYSIFGQWLKEKNMMTLLEDKLKEYTLFVPTNEAIKREMNMTVTTDWLKYYIISAIYETVSLTDGESLRTLLGIDHQLVFHAYTFKNTTINSVPIIQPDVWTFGGIVQGIDGLLHPVLHICNEIVKVIQYGKCVPCGAIPPCPDGYFPYEGHMTDKAKVCEYTTKSSLGSAALEKKSGCQGLCVKEKMILGCCKGYFGKDCQECPGGPETPCGGHGSCSDKINGTGQCTCHAQFQGSNCDSCIQGWTGPGCDIDMSSCQYMNGGCHRNALCLQHPSGTKICKCKGGLRGDGYNCTGPCDEDNGGCNRRAVCNFNPGEGVTCQCHQGFVGDGKDQCNADIFSTLALRNDSQTFFKNLNRLLPNDLLTKLQSINGTQFTVFLPVKNAKIADKMSVLEQIVEVPTVMKLAPPTGGGNVVATVTSLANHNITVVYDQNSAQYYVNGIPILQKNLPCTNGIIHLVAAPFTLLKPGKLSSTPLGAIVGPIVSAVIIATIAVVVYILYRRAHDGYWELFQKLLPDKKSSGPSVSRQSSVQSKEGEDEEEIRSGLPASGSNFENPLFRSDMLES